MSRDFSPTQGRSEGCRVGVLFTSLQPSQREEDKADLPHLLRWLSFAGSASTGHSRRNPPPSPQGFASVWRASASYGCGSPKLMGKMSSFSVSHDGRKGLIGVEWSQPSNSVCACRVLTIRKRETKFKDCRRDHAGVKGSSTERITCPPYPTPTWADYLPSVDQGQVDSAHRCSLLFLLVSEVQMWKTGVVGVQGESMAFG